MSDVSTKKRYSIGEEIANAVTHGIGAQFSIVALVLLLIRAVQCAPAELKSSYVIGIAIFGGSLIILYLASTLYHALSNPTAKRVFGVFDHSSIYLLIAGTYSAYCLTALHGALGWIILAIIWALAITGITFYSIFGSRMRKLSAISYIPMGLMIVVVSPAVKSSLLAASGGDASWYFLLLGGVFYIAGTAFYAMKKIKWMHSIWHLFVLAGSVMHFASIYLIMR
ncbi:MAG TPA: hemolysin III family protein [Treponemataceae bacterium]|nr:hemolysin III family protein [Treponemataceae bacterium]